MKNHKIPIGDIFGGHTDNQNTKMICIMFSIMLIVGLISILLLVNFMDYILLIVIISILIIICIATIFLKKAYKQSHILTPQEKEYQNEIKWHSITSKELIFVRTYFKEKGKMYLMGGGFIIFLFMIIPIIDHKWDISVMFLIIGISILAIFEIYILLWHNIDTSAECTYIPIYKIYSIDNRVRGGKIKTTHYAIVLIDGKKYIYKIDDINNSSDHIMIVNHKGLSCVINSKYFPN